MKLKPSLARLPDSLKSIIRLQPGIGSRLEQGALLEDILASPEWAEEWASSSKGALHYVVLAEIIARYASQPFELEQAIHAIGASTGMVGAEIRIAVLKLRRSGIVYAVRKAWGDQLVYLPADMVHIWRQLLFPLECGSLCKEYVKGSSSSSSAIRQRLSLELLSAWQQIERYPIVRTAAGTLHRGRVAKLSAALRFGDVELACLPLSYPHSDKLPVQAAVALDIGLVCGVLNELNDGMYISSRGLDAWLALTPAEADEQLYDWVMNNYAATLPAMHITASAFKSIADREWHCDGRLTVINDQEQAIDDWLGLMEAFGWAERGNGQQGKFFRKMIGQDSQISESTSRNGMVYIQPDCEIICPPEVALRPRWILSHIAERVMADAFWIYRLTQASCRRAASETGYTAALIVSFLEEASGAALPDSVAEAINDWLDQPLAEKEEKSALLKGEISVCEHVADRAGWMLNRPNLAEYEADRSNPGEEELFPGISDIPAMWIAKRRLYHASTCKELARLAIAWQTALELELDGEVRQFVPQFLNDEGADWTMNGRWRTSPVAADIRDERASVTVSAQRIDAIRIGLPSVDCF